MVREPGHYAVRDGRSFAVVKASGTTWLERSDGRDVGEELTLDQLDRLERVSVRASWHGGAVSVVRTSGDRADIWTRDGDLAARQDLTGDVREGWRATVPVPELEDVREVVAVEKGDGS